MAELCPAHVYELTGELEVGENRFQLGVQFLFGNGHSAADSALVEGVAGELGEHRVHAVLGVQEEDSILVARGGGQTVEERRVSDPKVFAVVDDRRELLVVADYDELARLRLERGKQPDLGDLGAFVHNHEGECHFEHGLQVLVSER